MNQSNIKLAEDHLYDDVSVMQKSGLTSNQVNVVLRIRDAYTMLRDNPSKKEREIVDHLITIYGIAKSQAYNDLKVVKILIGNFEQASRDWHLWKFNQRNEETRELARKWKNGNAMARCDHDYAKFNKLDQEEVTEIDNLLLPHRTLVSSALKMYPISWIKSISWRKNMQLIWRQLIPITRM